MYRTLHEARHQNRTHLGRPRRSDNMRVFGHTTSKRNGRLLLVQYWQHLINEHFQRGQSGKPSAIEHEIIDAQVDEAAHLFDHLLRRADKAKVIFAASPSARTSSTLFLTAARYQKMSRRFLIHWPYYYVRPSGSKSKLPVILRRF